MDLRISSDMMGEHWFRRILHLCTPIFLIYYLLPDPIWTDGPQKVQGLFILLGAVFVFEAIRLSTKKTLPGMRHYEEVRLASYAWASTGLAVLFLTTPIEIAAPVVLGMAWVDPLIGELRGRDHPDYPSVPIAVYFILTLASLTWFFGPDIRVVMISIVISPLAVWVEARRWWRLDDDFTMMVIPAAVAGVMAWTMGLF
jgi:dolichol kinase